jgi:hypothetical protein
VPWGQSSRDIHPRSRHCQSYQFGTDGHWCVGTWAQVDTRVGAHTQPAPSPVKFILVLHFCFSFVPVFTFFSSCNFLYFRSSDHFSFYYVVSFSLFTYSSL